MDKISFDISNARQLVLIQDAHDGPIHFYKEDAHGVIEETGKIRATDFVMLINLYNHIMENDIKNDFINPNGKVAE